MDKGKKKREKAENIKYQLNCIKHKPKPPFFFSLFSTVILILLFHFSIINFYCGFSRVQRPIFEMKTGSNILFILGAAEAAAGCFAPANSLFTPLP